MKITYFLSKSSLYWKEKFCLVFSNVASVPERYSSFSNMQISQVMKSYTQPNFDQILYEERYLSQFVSDMFDSLQ